MVLMTLDKLEYCQDSDWLGVTAPAPAQEISTNYNTTTMGDIIGETEDIPQQ